MILMVSGRTDIVAYYTPWFINRLKEGYVDVRNPFNPKLISRIDLNDVDGIMFCTKNPLPILPYLEKIDKPMIFHITLTPYLKDIEPNLPPKTEVITGIKQVSKIIGKQYTYVRYDPIFINKKYTINYHIKMFERLCNNLDGYIEHIIISFLDDYKNVRKNIKVLNPKSLTKNDYKKIGENFAKIATKHHMTVQSCFEDENLVEYGFIKEDCLSLKLAQELTGRKKHKKWNVNITAVNTYRPAAKAHFKLLLAAFAAQLLGLFTWGWCLLDTYLVNDFSINCFENKVGNTRN